MLFNVLAINVVSVYFVSDDRKRPARDVARKSPPRVAQQSPPRDMAPDSPQHHDVDAQIHHLPQGVPVREGGPDIEVVNKIQDDNDD